jgi:hypothetical protein
LSRDRFDLYFGHDPVGTVQTAKRACLHRRTREQDMLRIVGVISAISTLMSPAAFGDEVRRTAFAGTLLGTWARSNELCDTNDKSNIVISEAKYSVSDKSCGVQVIVETAGATGPNYSIRARCADPSDPSKTSITNLLIRPQSNDRISAGEAFDDLKSYQRCPVR